MKKWFLKFLNNHLIEKRCSYYNFAETSYYLRLDNKGSYSWTTNKSNATPVGYIMGCLFVNRLKRQKHLVSVDYSLIPLEINNKN
jgi:hypothetical protein